MASVTLTPARLAPARPARMTRPDRARREPSGGYRLTARGRAVALGASVAALVAIVVGAGQMVEASSVAATGTEPAVVVVQSGDTLWGIAQDIAPGVDPRSLVRQIREVNDLGNRAIVPGQSIVVPIAG